MATVVDSSNPKSDFPIQYRELNYLNCSKGWKSWFFTLDHKRIGIMYLIGVTCAFFLGGLFAVLLRTELLSPARILLSADGYNQMFTLHGAIMTFLVIIPGVPAAIGNI
ncbi:MAG TPA: cytochrome c oxidase subunit I, partial [Planctomycetaceae bacterium]|nr:cytochrome c oxidase subunit I [Planctomycetaceae bacterium]